MAKVMSYSYILKLSRQPDIDEGFYSGWEENLQKEFGAWAENTQGATFYMFTLQGFSASVTDDIDNDFNLIFSAIILVAIYTILFLGSFSPIHCRCIVALAGLLTVGIAYTSGFGLMYILGG